MSTAVVLASSLLALLLALAWGRELRLRRALQRLLARLFLHRRRRHDPDPPATAADDGDRDAGRRRL